MDKEDIVHICNGILLNHKNEWNLSIYDNIDRPRGYYAKWNKSEKDKYCMISLYMESKKQNTWTNRTKQKQTHRYREQTGCCPKGGGRGNEWNRWARLRDTNFQLQNKWK